MPLREGATLWDLITQGGDLASRFIVDGRSRLLLSDLANRPDRRGAAPPLFRRSVVLFVTDQLSAARALAALDGTASRLTICPAGLAPDLLPKVIRRAEADSIVVDRSLDSMGASSDMGCTVYGAADLVAPDAGAECTETEWVLFTSGTTGMPKLVAHTLTTLTGEVTRIRSLGARSVWSTFYDIRRYGGLQILLRALIAGGSMVLSDIRETSTEFLRRVARERVSHISGTPSHWRMALMSGAAGLICPSYVRMSGEVADEAIIAALREEYPKAVVSHAFASTEAGLAFDVDDGHAGFPRALVSEANGAVVLRVDGGSLRVRSPRAARRYLGDDMPPLADAEGFVDTGDMVELRGDRYHFVGRRDGVINIGGQKIHPEEVEAVINHHPDVRMSLVKARRSPIVGSLVVADVVLQANGSGREETRQDVEAVRNEIIQLCRGRLASFKVPASVRIVPGLEIASSGKLVRGRA